MKILLVLFAFAVNGAVSYRSYTDSYATMGDIDWGKRSGYNNWISPAYGYASMADSDWGWKKRGDVLPAAGGEDEEAAVGALEAVPRVRASTGYKRADEFDDDDDDQTARWRQLYYNLYRPKASPSRRFTYSRPIVRQKPYAYHSMADIDWGWKKRSVLPAIPTKRHLGSLEHQSGVNYHRGSSQN